DTLGGDLLRPPPGTAQPSDHLKPLRLDLVGLFLTPETSGTDADHRGRLLAACRRDRHRQLTDGRRSAVPVEILARPGTPLAAVHDDAVTEPVLAGLIVHPVDQCEIVIDDL